MYFFRLSDYCRGLLNEKSDHFVTKSVTLARFLQAITQLCPHFHRCCTFSNSTDDWIKICDTFNNTSQNLWINWINHVVNETKKHCQELDDLSLKKMLKIFMASLFLITVFLYTTYCLKTQKFCPTQ